MEWVRAFAEIGLRDIPLVGGKNASLGEMRRELAALGVAVPDGFATTAAAYRLFIENNQLEPAIRDALATLDGEIATLVEVSKQIRTLIDGAELPAALCDEVRAAYCTLAEATKTPQPSVAVRSSATAEDLPTASFAGQQESYLNVRGEAELLRAVKQCYGSLFTARAISYRQARAFDHLDVALSVGVQHMVRSDKASAGVMFTLDTESGFRDVILVSSAWGVGESVVSGKVSPDEIYVHKPTLEAGHPSIVWKRCGDKATHIVVGDDGRLKTENTTKEDRRRLSISDDDVLTLARWGLVIEEHYSKVHGTPTPMDIEWAKDGITGNLYVVQARPETVHSRRTGDTLSTYKLLGHGPLLCEGVAVGSSIASGKAHLIASANAIESFVPGEVLVTDSTDPNWEPVMKIASAIVTERGSRTSHAAIVAREVGVPAVVGAKGAMSAIADGGEVTVSCIDGVGRVLKGAVPFSTESVDPSELPATRTKLMLNLAQPERAFAAAHLPSDGVGLARMEFVFAGWVGVHPLALLRYSSLPPKLRRLVDRKTDGASDRPDFFVDRLSQGIATIAAAFYPRPVILRFSDFKSNEYAQLVGGEPFEAVEENPMLGWRGASRYHHADFRDAFLLEVEAVRRVRETMGLTNLKLMVPFCRTPEEGRAVLDIAASGGLVQSESLEILVMAEIPSNILLADRFAEIFDGFSIGSNDLTQLVLGVDRDSEKIAHLFDERNEAVKRACAMLLEAAHRAGRPVGICGQAPSDHPSFAKFLVEHGIDSISLSPDALVSTRRLVAACEAQ